MALIKTISLGFRLGLALLRLRQGIRIMLMTGLVLTAMPAAADRYVTWESLEPDTWASIWLINKFIDHDAQIKIVPTGAETQPEDGIAFAILGSAYYRTQQASVYEQLVTANKITDPHLLTIGRWMHALEINPWQATEETPQVERFATLVRDLQGRYPQHRAPPECYAELFDRIYAALSSQQNLQSLSPSICQYPSNLSPAERTASVLVAQLPIPYLLDLIAAGKRIAFVDVREAEEFAENHIPGAINLTLRDLTDTNIQTLKQADWVVSYCKKDFRGYEMAQALAQRGISNSAVMQPYGIVGWQSLKLPIKTAQENEFQAEQRLQLCAKNPASCLKAVR